MRAVLRWLLSAGCAQLDKDGDGIITRDEWYAKYGNYDGFDKYDIDGEQSSLGGREQRVCESAVR